MKVFQDIFTNDEVMSETYPFTLAYNDAIMKVKSSYKNKESVGNVDIGCGNAFGGEEEGGNEDGPSEKVLDITFNFLLAQQHFSKPDFMAYIKPFLKNLKAHLDENGPEGRSDEFQKGAQEFVKFVISKFDEFEFYLGTSEKLEGALIFSFWEDEAAAGPMFYFFKDAVKEVKY